MILVSVCLPSDAFSQCLLSYLGLSYLGCGVAPLSHAHGPSLNHQVDRVNRSAEVSQCPSSERQSFILLFTDHLLTLITSSSGSLSWLYFLSCSIGHTHYIPYLLLSLRTVLSRKWKCYLLSHVQLCDCMNCSLLGSCVHGVLQARRLEWIAILSSRGSSHPRDPTQDSCVSCIAGRFFTHWATWDIQVRDYNYNLVVIPRVAFLCH